MAKALKYFAYKVSTKSFNGVKLPDQIGTKSYHYSDKADFLFVPLDQLKKREIWYFDTPEEIVKLLRGEINVDYEIRSKLV